MVQKRIPIVVPLLMCLMSMLVFSGCASRHAHGPSVFFPPPPDPPRVQFLKGISSARDIEGDSDSFSLLIFGKTDKKKEKPIVKPFGLAVHGGKLYIADAGASRVTIIDFAKETMDFVKGNYGPGKMKKPVHVAVDRDGSLYVADTERREVLCYDPDGNFLRAIGKELEMRPVSVLVDEKSLYVLDIRNHLIKAFDKKTGTVAGEIGRGKDQSDSLAMPISMNMSDKGTIYVTNALSGRVMQLDIDGHVLSSFGQLGDAFGEFGRPRGVFASEGIIYVVDGAHQNVQMFNEKGRLLMFFGDPGLPVGSLNLPAEVAVSTENLEYFQKLADPTFVLDKVIFVSNQFGASKISIYGFGHRKESAPAGAPQPSKEKVENK